MAKGDHLFCSQGAYQHHAIEMGDETVIQYGGPDFRSLRVEIVPISNLTRHGQVHIVEQDASFDSDEVIERALSRIGEDNYCLFTNNCEHFVNWCRHGQAESRQVDRITERAASASVKVASKLTSRWAQKLGGRWLLKRLPRSAMPLLVAADIAQLGAEVVASSRGSQPERAEKIGQAVGLGASVSIGAAVGGPIGAAASAGVWAAGELFGKIVLRRNTDSSECR